MHGVCRLFRSFTTRDDLIRLLIPNEMAWKKLVKNQMLLMKDTWKTEIKITIQALFFTDIWNLIKKWNATSRASERKNYMTQVLQKTQETITKHLDIDTQTLHWNPTSKQVTWKNRSSTRSKEIETRRTEIDANITAFYIEIEHPIV